MSFNLCSFWYEGVYCSLLSSPNTLFCVVLVTFIGQTFVDQTYKIVTLCLDFKKIFLEDKNIPYVSKLDLDDLTHKGYGH